MTDYDTSWVPEGHMLKVSKKESSSYENRGTELYVAHLTSGQAQDPLGLYFHHLGDYTPPGFWGRIFGGEPTFESLVVGEDLPTDEHIVSAFERVRKAYDKYHGVKSAEDKFLGTYPPNTVKNSKKGKS